MDKKKSKGIIIISSLYRIWGVLGLIFSATVIWMLFSPHTSEYISQAIIKIFPIPLNPWAIILIAIAISVFSLMVANGLSNLEEWARKWTLYLSIFAIIYGLVETFTKGFEVGSFIMSAIIIYFFIR